MRLVRHTAKSDPREMGAKCDECPLQHQKPTQCDKVTNATLIVMGESPGRMEERIGRPFVGESGRWLDDCLGAVGASRARLHVTNAVLCRPKEKMVPKEWKKALECCQPRLQNELKDVQCKTILAFGAKALQQTTGKAKIMDWIGAPLPSDVKFGEGYTILPALHPAFALRKPWFTPPIRIHLARAWGIAQGKLSKWEWPPIIIEGTDAICNALEQILADGLPIGVDVETSGIDPFNSELLNVGIANKDVAVSVQWHHVEPVVKYMVGRVLESDLLKVMHNGQFDYIVFASQGLKVVNFGFDTLIAHSIVAPQLPHKLAFVSCVETHAPRWKDEFRIGSDDAGTNRFVNADPTARAVYNARDAFITVYLLQPLTNRLKRLHRGMDQFTQKMNLIKIAIDMRIKGVTVDEKVFETHKRTLRIKRIESIRKLRKQAKSLGFFPYNPDNNNQTRDLFINRLNVQAVEKTATGQAKFDAKVLTELCTHVDSRVKDLAWDLLQYRKVNKLLKTYVLGGKFYA